VIIVASPGSNRGKSGLTFAKSSIVAFAVAALLAYVAGQHHPIRTAQIVGTGRTAMKLTMNA